VDGSIVNKQDLLARKIYYTETADDNSLGDPTCLNIYFLISPAAWVSQKSFEDGIVKIVSYNIILK